MGRGLAGPGGLQRRLGGGGGRQGWHRLALFVPPYLVSEGYVHLEEPLPSTDGEEPLRGGAGRAPRGHPDPADLLPRARLSGQRGGPARARPPQGDGPQPRDAGPEAEKKTHATKPFGGGGGGRDERSPRSARQRRRLVIWSVNIGRGLGGGKRDSGRGFI